MPIKNLNNKGIAVVPLAITLVVFAVAGYFAYQKYSVSDNQTAMKEDTSLAANNEETDVLQATSNSKPFNPNFADVYFKNITGETFAVWNKKPNAALVGIGRSYSDRYEDNPNVDVTDMYNCYFYTRGAKAQRVSYNGYNFSFYKDVAMFPSDWRAQTPNFLVIIPESSMVSVNPNSPIKPIPNDCGTNMIIFRTSIGSGVISDFYPYLTIQRPSASVRFYTNAYRVPSFDQEIQVDIEGANDVFMDSFRREGINIVSVNGSVKNIKFNVPAKATKFSAKVTVNLNNTKSIQFKNLTPSGINNVQFDSGSGKGDFWVIMKSFNGIERGPRKD